MEGAAVCPSAPAGPTFRRETEREVPYMKSAFIQVSARDYFISAWLPLTEMG